MTSEQPKTLDAPKSLGWRWPIAMAANRHRNEDKRINYRRVRRPIRKGDPLSWIVPMSDHDSTTNRRGLSPSRSWSPSLSIFPLLPVFHFPCELSRSPQRCFLLTGSPPPPPMFIIQSFLWACPVASLVLYWLQHFSNFKSFVQNAHSFKQASFSSYSGSFSSFNIENALHFSFPRSYGCGHSFRLGRSGHYD